MQNAKLMSSSKILQRSNTNEYTKHLYRFINIQSKIKNP